MAQVTTVRLRRLIEEAESSEEPISTAMWCLELAQVHTALAQVAATTLKSEI
jgi:hypothetical protein